LMTTCHMVVLPTVYGEGVPRILVEGAAAGLPLIGTDMPGCREIIKPGVNGTLVTPGNLAQLVEAIETTAADSFLRERYGRASRRLAQHEYSQDHVNTQTLLTYQLALRSAQ
jgi:glycosyltransferase involved in cell wall biosynthesis